MIYICGENIIKYVFFVVMFTITCNVKDPSFKLLVFVCYVLDIFGLVPVEVISFVTL